MGLPEELAKEHRGQVYWRTCSRCGDIDRDSLEKALACVARAAVERCIQVAEKQRVRAHEQAANDPEQTRQDRHAHGWRMAAAAAADIGREMQGLLEEDAATGYRDDDPEMDGTDAAHPAWWRGHDRAFEVLCAEVHELLDGKPPTGVCTEPWESLRQRLHAIYCRIETLHKTIKGGTGTWKP